MKINLELLRGDEGQGLVEYLLIVAMIALACIAGMTTLANAINSAFSQVGTILGQYIP